MGVQYNMTGVPQETLQGRKLQIALGMGIPELTQIANSGRTVNGVDSLTAVMALQIKGPAEKAQRQQQAANQPPKQTVKDQVVAQAAPEDVGIGALPAGEVMTEKAMASGGIVAFQSGGTIEDLTKELNELKRQRQALTPRQTTFRGPAPNAASAATLDAKIADIENKLRLAQNQSGFVADRRGLLEQGVTPAEFGTPPDLLQEQQGQQGQQGQQSTGGAQTPPAYAPRSLYPQFERLGKQAAADIRNIDIGGIAAAAANNPRLSGLFGPTRQQYIDEFSPQRAQLEKVVPESEAAALKKIQEREAGLEALSAKREQRATEAYQRAEKESNVGKGEALIALAGTLVSAPVASERFQQGIGQFASMLGTVRKDLSKAASERDKALDLIEESKELRKIGQFEKAEAKFLQGQERLFNFDMAIKQGAIASDIARSGNILNYADKQANKDIKAIENQLSVLTTGLKEEAATERARLDAASAERRANIIYGGSGAGGSKEIDRARDNAARDLKAWAETNKTLLLTDPNAYDRKKQELLRAEFKSLGYTDTQVNAMLGAGSSVASPTGQKVLKFGDIKF